MAKTGEHNYKITRFSHFREWNNYAYRTCLHAHDTMNSDWLENDKFLGRIHGDEAAINAILGEQMHFRRSDSFDPSNVYESKGLAAVR